MSELFQSLKKLEDIQSLIDSGVRESEVLEYKEASRKFTDKEKNEIGKDVSAMANSGGGAIVYGVSTDRNDTTRPLAIESLAVKNIETFDRVLNSTIQPPVKGIEKRLLPQGQPRVMVVYIPPSEEPPHQNLVGKKYYRRSGVESIPMEHDLVALHFGRRLGPILSLRFQPLNRPNTLGGDPAFSNELLLRVLVENAGKRIGRFVEVVLFFPEQGHATPIRAASGNAVNIDALHPGRQARQFTENIGVFHPGMSKRILELGFGLSKEFIANPPNEPFIEWIIYSDNMNPRQGTVSLRELGWA